MKTQKIVCASILAAATAMGMLAGCSDEENVSESPGSSFSESVSSDEKDTKSTEMSIAESDKNNIVEIIQNSVTMEGQTLNLTGVSNARQLGGYITDDGMRVKSNILLRSGKLADGTDEDLAVLQDKYNLTKIIDFRTSYEIAESPDPDMSSVDNIQIKILDENSTDENNNAAIAGIHAQMDDPFAGILEMYRMGVLKDDMYTSMFDNEIALNGYREFINELLSHDDGAILWHCTGGKDRAGVASMILLTLLGVDKETILQDFDLTNNFVRQKIDYMVSGVSQLTDNQEELDGVASLIGVSRQMMENVFEKAESENGSMLEFLKAKLNITDEEIKILRSKYLEIV